MVWGQLTSERRGSGQFAIPFSASFPFEAVQVRGRPCRARFPFSFSSWGPSCPFATFIRLPFFFRSGRGAGCDKRDGFGSGEALGWRDDKRWIGFTTHRGNRRRREARALTAGRLYTINAVKIWSGTRWCSNGPHFFMPRACGTAT